MTPADGDVLVTGITGQQGGSVARALLAAGYSVHALTRRPDSVEARRLAGLGATVVAGSFDAPGSIERAAAGAHGMFLMGNFFEAGAEGETRQGIAAAEAAARAGIRHLVYSSVASADRGTGIPHFESKYRVEQHLAGLGIGHTIVAPVAFMDNLTAPWSLDGLRQGTIAMPLPAGRANQLVAVEDIGPLVRAVLERGASLFGKRIEIAGETLSGAEQAGILSRVAGRPFGYYEVPLATVRESSPESALMFEWIDRAGYDVDIAALRAAFPEVAWTGFEAWARRVALPAIGASAGPAEAA